MKRILATALAGLAILCAQAADAQVRIDGLPGATVPLNGGEVIPLFQAGKTVNTTAERVRATFAGISAPASPFIYQLWIDNSGSVAVLKQYDGSVWVTIGTLDPAAHAWLPGGTLPAPTPTTLGGVNSKSATSHQFFTAISTAGAVSAAQPTTGDISGAGTAITKNVGTSVADPGTGALESLSPIQTTTGSSKTFVAADLQKETRRSNSGSAMTDTFPASSASGMANGSRITVANADSAGTDTITAGAGTSFSAGSTDVIEAGRSVTYIYDSAATTWRKVFNGSSSAIFSSTGSNVSGNLVSMASAYGKVQDSGVASSAVAQTGTANTFTAKQSFNSGDLSLNGSSSGSLIVKPAAAAGTNTLTLPAGTTDFSSTGGTSQVVQQSTAGGALTVGQLSVLDLSTGNVGSGQIVLGPGTTAFTPTITGSTSGTATLSAAVGSWEKAGNAITLRITAVMSANAMVGTPHISIPATSANITNDNGLCYVAASGATLQTGYTQVSGLIAPNTSFIALQETGSGKTVVGMGAGELAATSIIEVSCSYRT